MRVCVCILAFDAMHLGGHIVSWSPLALVTTTTANFSASEASRDAKSPVGRWTALSFISFSACWRLSRLPWRTTIEGNEKVKQHETTRFLCLLVFLRGMGRNWKGCDSCRSKRENHRSAGISGILLLAKSPLVAVPCPVRMAIANVYICRICHHNTLWLFNIAMENGP